MLPEVFCSPHSHEWYIELLKASFIYYLNVLRVIYFNLEIFFCPFATFEGYHVLLPVFLWSQASLKKEFLIYSKPHFIAVSSCNSFFPLFHFLVKN